MLFYILLFATAAFACEDFSGCYNNGYQILSQNGCDGELTHDGDVIGTYSVDPSTGVATFQDGQRWTMNDDGTLNQHDHLSDLLAIWPTCIEETEEPATCDDGMKNGDEYGVDCGGSCDKNCQVEYIQVDTEGTPCPPDYEPVGLTSPDECHDVVLEGKSIDTMNFAVLDYSVLGCFVGWLGAKDAGETYRIQWRDPNDVEGDRGYRICKRYIAVEEDDTDCVDFSGCYNNGYQILFQNACEGELTHDGDVIGTYSVDPSSGVATFQDGQIWTMNADGTLNQHNYLNELLAVWPTCEVRDCVDFSGCYNNGYQILYQDGCAGELIHNGDVIGSYSVNPFTATATFQDGQIWTMNDDGTLNQHNHLNELLAVWPSCPLVVDTPCRQLITEDQCNAAGYCRTRFFANGDFKKCRERSCKALSVGLGCQVAPHCQEKIKRNGNHKCKRV